MTTTTMVFKTLPTDETIVATKGTAERNIQLLESLGFMTLSFRVVEYKKLPFLKLWRSRHLDYFEGTREEALEKFDAIES